LGTPQDFGGTIQDGAGGGVLSVIKTGDTTQTFSGNNTYTGGTIIQQGTLRASSNTALGIGPVTVTNNGSGDGTLELGDIAISNIVGLVGRASSTTAHIMGAAGGISTANGNVGLVGTGDANFNFESAGGTLNLNGGIGVAGGSLGNVTVNLGGDGDGVVSGLSLVGIGGTGNLNKTGGGTWTVSGASINNAGQVHVSAGSLALSGAASFGGSTSFVVDSDAALNVIDVTGGFGLSSGQSIFGNGEVIGDVTAASGSTVGPGASIGTLTVNGNLDLEGTLFIELTGVGGGSSDLLIVTGNLDIAGAALDFAVLSSLDDSAYVFATYGGTLSGTFASIDPISGYTVDYDYGGNSIALVRDAGPGPVPSPAPLLLMAAGAFGLAGSRRWMNR
jgi:autotransporter-associated beta strand protein